MSSVAPAILAIVCGLAAIVFAGGGILIYRAETRNEDTAERFWRQ